ncbi:MAG: hypothetical protein ACP5K9_01670 [Candidatus Micrarchaeia archaeon]
MASKAVIAGLIVILIAAIISIVIFVPAKAPVTSPPLATLAVQLTDPAQVPYGTEALNVNYSSVQVHYIYGNSSGWVNAGGSGSVNLLSLVNLSKTIGSASLPVNATIDMARFNITSSSIMINGTTYPVTIPSQQITAHITSKGMGSGYTGLLLDLSPSVATIYTLNSTIFVMVPSIKAVVVPGLNASSASLDNEAHINAKAREQLDSAAPNITITSASLSANGNSTDFSVTVKDNSNSTVVINHIMIFGNTSIAMAFGGAVTQRDMQMPAGYGGVGDHGVGAGSYGNISAALGTYFNSSSGAAINESTILKIMRNKNITDLIEHYANVSIGANATQENVSMMVGEVEKHFEGEFGNISAMANISASAEANLSYVEKNWESMKNLWDSIKDNMTALGLNSSALESRWHEIEASHIAIEQSHFKVINFVVESNGTLVLPFAEAEFEGPGYTLAAGQSVTFSFDNVVGYGARGSVEADNSTFGFGAHVVAKPISGNTYKIVISGEEGVRASTNVTAS